MYARQIADAAITAQHQHPTRQCRLHGNDEIETIQHNALPFQRSEGPTGLATIALLPIGTRGTGNGQTLPFC
ncbi:MAG: hypothetical protein U0Y68_00920 [Blastocatellia bacterium]